MLCERQALVRATTTAPRHPPDDFPIERRQRRQTVAFVQHTGITGRVPRGGPPSNVVARRPPASPTPAAAAGRSLPGGVTGATDATTPSDPL